MNRYELVFLDADETLYDFRKAEGCALREAFDRRGYELGEEELGAYDDINKELWRRVERGDMDQRRLKTERFRLLFERLGLDEDAESFGALYVERLSEATFLLEGAQELCEYLAGKYRLAIITNGIKEVQRSRFERSPIKSYVERLIVSEEAGCSKPDPGIFENACELMGFRDKARMIMIGDSLASDIQGGINFGIDSCWLNLAAVGNETGIRPTYEARSLWGIRGIL
jgi:2-haloacid dehalogenase